MIFIYRQRPISRQYIQETHIDGRFDSAQAISQRTQQIKALGEKFFTSWGAGQILLSRFFFVKGYRDQRDSRFSRILEIFVPFSLLVLDLEPFQFHFHFSKKVKAIRISLFFLENKEWNQVRGIISPLSLFPIVFQKIVKSQASISLKILAKFQF